MVPVDYSNVAIADIKEYVPDAEDKKLLLDWVDTKLTVFPELGMRLMPPEATSRRAVIDRRWIIIWEVEFDEQSDPTRVVIQRVVPAKSSLIQAEYGPLPG